jgi:hypothetical protein
LWRAGLRIQEGGRRHASRHQRRDVRPHCPPAARTELRRTAAAAGARRRFAPHPLSHAHAVGDGTRRRTTIGPIDDRAGEMVPEIRPGAIISRAFQIYRDQAATLLGTALIIFAIQLPLALLLPKLAFIAGLAVLHPEFYDGMVVNLVRDVQDRRRDQSISELFRSVTPVLLPLVALAIVAGIGIAIGFVLLIIPA